MNYIDGYVAAVPTANKEKYLEHVKFADSLFKEYGATKLVECWGDDVPEGEVTSFPMAVKCKPDETVVFSWAVWPDKKTRDKGMESMMKDDRMSADTMPFDAKRIIWGGFQMIFEG